MKQTADRSKKAPATLDMLRDVKPGDDVRFHTENSVWNLVVLTGATYENGRLKGVSVKTTSQHVHRDSLLVPRQTGVDLHLTAGAPFRMDGVTAYPLDIYLNDVQVR